MTRRRIAVLLVGLLCATTELQGAPGPAEVAGALRSGDVATLQTYLAAGGDPSAADSGGSTLLHLAAEAGNTEAVRALLRAGADPQARDGTHSVPLHLAAARNRVEAARLLLEAGTPVDVPGFTTRDGVSASTPLILAAELGSLDVARLLVDRGADVNAVNNFDRTPLFWARKARRAELVEFLEGAGAVSDPEEALAQGGHRTGDGSTAPKADEPSRSASRAPPAESSPGVLSISGGTPQEGGRNSDDDSGGDDAGVDDSGEAIGRLRQAVKANPDDPRALLRLGVAYRKAGTSKRAARALLRAVELAPRSAAARAQLTLVLWDLDRKEAARKQLRAVKALDPERARRLRAALASR